jgi:6-pyruvoyl-tetrahydropterin synthase
MFSVQVRDHIMIAHSFKGDLFGPAQALHGATFVVDAAFYAPKLTEEGVVVDIGRAIDTLKAILQPLNYQNLDTLDVFAGQNTTTEVLSKFIFDALASAIAHGDLGAGSENLTRLKVTLGESHVAWATYEADLAR